MIPSLRDIFNRAYTDDKHQLLLKRLDALCGTPVDFRVSETPCFIPRYLIEAMQKAGAEIVHQIVSNKEYLKKSAAVIPPEYNVPNESAHPLFVSVDFGLVQDGNGRIVPKLIELQGFPTLYGYQVILCQLYKEIYDLPRDLTSFLNGYELESYLELLRKAVLGTHAPENVVLLELDPLQQKTLPDFMVMERLCGVTMLNIRDVVKEGRKLFYKKNGHLVPVHRVYNRVIVDELMKSGTEPPFSFRDELELEWAGHPNWFFHISKFSIPFLSHATVPKTVFLSDLTSLPDNLDAWVLKPLFSFAGAGVKVGPTRAEIEAIAPRNRREFVLQEKVEYGAVVDTPFGGTKAEVRIMYIWLDNLKAVNNLVRMGRGKMMGVDHNRNMAWVGGSAGLYLS